MISKQLSSGLLQQQQSSWSSAGNATRKIYWSAAACSTFCWTLCLLSLKSVPCLFLKKEKQKKEFGSDGFLISMKCTIIIKHMEPQKSLLIITHKKCSMFPKVKVWLNGRRFLQSNPKLRKKCHKDKMLEVINIHNLPSEMGSYCLLNHR